MEPVFVLMIQVAIMAAGGGILYYLIRTERFPFNRRKMNGDDP